ncbi:MAG TPA: exodeoxyribonuclease III [Candidatus Paceibacterota bacterium]
MRIVSWNVNGIRSLHKKGMLTPLIEKVKPDVLCLQETKAHQHQSEVDLPQYEEYWNSADKKGYSGTAIFSKEKPLSVILGLPAQIVTDFGIKNDGYGDPNAEGRVIAAEYPDLYVVTVYTPNAKDDLSRLKLRHKHWDPAFLSYCRELEAEKPVVFCGDLNVAHTPDDLANPKPNDGKKGFTKEEREGIDNMIDEGFVDTFRMFTVGPGHYTWWSPFSGARERNVGWRIDYIFASEDLISKIRRAEILADYMGSDHCPVLLDISN